MTERRFWVSCSAMVCCFVGSVLAKAAGSPAVLYTLLAIGVVLAVDIARKMP